MKTFTPICAETGERVTMEIEEDFLPRGYGWRRTVTEVKTGKKYKARGASCGIPRCICDAVIYGYKSQEDHRDTNN